MEILSGGAMSNVKLRKGVPDRPLGKVGYVKVEAVQVRQRSVPLLIPDREAIPAAVVEVADAGQMDMVWTDDLRLYAWAQFFPFLALVLILRLFPPKYTGTRYWVIAAALYALAKLLEFLDEKIYSLGSIVSGHTLKHLAAAAASLATLRLLQTRRPIAP
jgi:hypothetical protein